jgi:hypothetical protein
MGIEVRAGENWKGQPGYGWDCTEHPNRVQRLHLFNRWTDRVRSTPEGHPWERAMRSAHLHLQTYHPVIWREIVRRVLGQPERPGAPVALLPGVPIEDSQVRTLDAPPIGG